MEIEVAPAIHDQIRATASALHWSKVGVRHHHGICVPLAALHSDQSAGIGDYHDLISLIDWCADVGFSVIQLLPLNDSGPDPSPYNGMSAFALHPIYLSLNQIEQEAHSDYLTGKLSQLRPYNASQRVSYSFIGDMKEAFCKSFFLLKFPSLKHEEPYQAFIERHRDWLEPYALYQLLKSQHGGRPWRQWPEVWHKLTPHLIHQLHQEHEEFIHYHYFLQYLCHDQMVKAKRHAEKKGVLLMGDLPILISPDSVDVWWNSSLFDLKLSVGAPPDQYSQEGQNWGFPLYNWNALVRDNFHWWRRRLQVAQDFFHLYRLDHVVGFFRLWAKPADKPKAAGRFYPEDPQEWIPRGNKLLLTLLETSSMLPIGEDLGEVSSEVRSDLQMLGIPGTKVMRWERDWEHDRSFFPFNQYPALSMTTLSTHDSSCLQEWWKSSPDEAKAFCQFKGWTYETELSYGRHWELLRDGHHTSSLFHINLLQEYLSAIPGLSWPDPKDERINTPGTTNSRNWTYRYRPSLEQLHEQDKLKKHISETLA